MTIRFACPKCRAVMTAPDGRDGANGRCPNCGQVFQVPRTFKAAPEPEGDEEPVVAEWDDDEPMPRRRRREVEEDDDRPRRRRPDGSRVVVQAAWALYLVCALLLVGGWLLTASAARPGQLDGPNIHHTVGACLLVVAGYTCVRAFERIMRP